MESRDRSQVTFYAIAGVLMVLGLGFLVAAVISFQDDGGSQASPSVPRASTAPPTPTPFEEVESARTTPTQAAQVSPTRIMPTGTATVEPTSTPLPEPEVVDEPVVEGPAPTPVPEPELEPPDPLEPEPADPTEEATEEPTAEPTAVPTVPPTPVPGPAVQGPASLSVGEPGVFSASYVGGEVPLRFDWSWAGGGAAIVTSVTTTFNGDGCYPITLTALYPSGTQMSVAHYVAVGEGSC